MSREYRICLYKEGFRRYRAVLEWYSPTLDEWMFDTSYRASTKHRAVRQGTATYERRTRKATQIIELGGDKNDNT